jgi:hypothetical protein
MASRDSWWPFSVSFVFVCFLFSFFAAMQHRGLDVLHGSGSVAGVKHRLGALSLLKFSAKFSSVPVFGLNLTKTKAI